MLMGVLISGYDLIEWLMDRLSIEESGEFYQIHKFLFAAVLSQTALMSKSCFNEEKGFVKSYLQLHLLPRFLQTKPPWK